MKSNIEIAHEVINGKWGNGAERKEKLTNAGYDFSEIQGIVNALISANNKPISDEPVFEIKGTEIMEVEINLSKYKGIKLTFKAE